MARYAAVALFVLALLPRVVAPGEFVTVDEAYHWFERAELFRAALQQANYADTNLIGHPGVTTLWLGALGAQAHDLAAVAGWINPDDTELYRAFLSFPVGVATALCVALAYPLLRRLFGEPVALLAALLWAADPFLVAHSKILHVDALLTSFMTLSLLAALVAAGYGPPYSGPASPSYSPINTVLLLASAVAGGLALLTKSPSVALLPIIGGIILWRHIMLYPLLGALRATVEALALWLMVALVVWVALWPAAWVDLPGVVERVVLQVAYEGASPHGWGNFFLGQPVDDPGPLFYPVAIALRLTSWATIGLLAVLAAVLAWRKHAVLPVRGLLPLLLFVALFVVMLTIPPKKFDRYALPIFPTLNILAATGLVWLWQGAQARLPWQWLTRYLLPAGLSLWIVATLLWYHPYELAYYNPLLGGGPTAARLIPVGWGEGMAQAGRYIRARWNGCDRPVASWFEPVLQPFVCTPVLRLREAAEPGRVDYAVLYIDQVQRNNEPEVTAMLQERQPVHTVRIHGIDYARVYQLPLPLENQSGATFGPDIRLHSYEIDTAALRSSEVLTVTLQWQALADIATDYAMFAHVLDSQGRRVGQIDVPPGGPRAPTSIWQAGHYITWHHPVPVAPELAPGTYWLSLGLYHPADAARLPLRGTAPPDAPDDGADALLLGPILLP
jgi:4-amino-4-deoxy-L-arabinose transferase-like glycosyltransferase